MDQAKPGLAGFGEMRRTSLHALEAKLCGTATPGEGRTARVVDRDREIGNRLGLGRDTHDLEEAAHGRSVARDTGPHFRPSGESRCHAFE